MKDIKEKRMLDKILDNYYFNKLTQMIKDECFGNYLLDCRIKKIKNTNIFEIYIKRAKYNDEHYKLLETIRKGECFEYIINWKDYKEYLKIDIEEYIRHNK